MMPRPSSARHVRLAGLAATVLLAACGARADTPEASEPPAVTVRPDEVALVATRLLATGPTLSGTLTPRREATLRAEVAGLVTSVPVEEGQTVTTGQVLLRLDDTAIRDAALSARSGVRTATEALTLARRNAERTARLAAEGAVAERDLETARVQVTSAEGGLAEAEARQAAADKQLEKTVIRAAWAGVVSARAVNPGDIVTMGTALVTVVDPASLRLEATVPVSALQHLRRGSAVTFRVSGLDTAQFTGRIEQVNPAVDPATRQVRLQVTLPNTAGRLVAGLYAEGRIATSEVDALAVPADAVDVTGAAPFVRRIRAGQVETVGVTLGLRDEVLGLVEIRDGLAAGDTVLTGQAATLTPGTLVRIVRE